MHVHLHTCSDVFRGGKTCNTSITGDRSLLVCRPSLTVFFISLMHKKLKRLMKNTVKAGR